MKFHGLSKGVLITALLVCLPLTSAWATHRSEAEQAIAEARAAHEQAVSANAASPETAAMIEQAEGLLPLRQYTKAVELAIQAKRQDDFAVRQAAGGKGGDSDAKSQAEAALAAAEAARAKADSVGGEWRDTAKMIAEAEGLVKSGSYQEAIALANRARVQGERGYEQALGEREAGFPSYMIEKP
ncbi:hypothetical protein CKO27_17175 [Thiocystis violacea]|nr:hypothetical protein [Thiocystis violacea]